jgi:hypothetical protein
MYNSCDGGHDTNGEIRVLPFSGGNLLLCRSCYRKELASREEWNRQNAPYKIFWQDGETIKHIKNPRAVETPSWYDLKVYNPE